MSDPSWNIELSLANVRAFAWGTRASEEYASSEACLSLLVHADGSVYMVIVEANPHDILVLDFCRVWYISTYKRWGTTILSYRAEGAGLFLVFPRSTSLERFEQCCDRILFKHVSSARAPTLQELADLDIIRAPRVVGGFLGGNAASGEDSDSVSSQDIEELAEELVDGDSDDLEALNQSWSSFRVRAGPCLE